MKRQKTIGLYPSASSWRTRRVACASLASCPAGELVGSVGQGPAAGAARVCRASLGVGVSAGGGVGPAGVVGVVLVEHAAPAGVVGFLHGGGGRRRGPVPQGRRRRGRAGGEGAQQGQDAPPAHPLAVPSAALVGDGLAGQASTSSTKSR